MNRYIDVDELIRKINEYECYSYDSEVSRICELINDAPTLDVEPVRHGHWIRESVGSDNSSEGYFKISMAECSECGTCVMGKPNYCPNCGAKMDGKEQEHEYVD